MSVTDELLRNNEAYAAELRQGRPAAAPGQEGRGRRLHGRPPGRPRPARARARRRARDPQRRRRRHRRRDPLAGDLPAPARHRGDRADPPHRLRHADVHRRRASAATSQDDTGIKPPWSPESFTDLDADVRSSIGRIKAQPVHPAQDAVRGFVYDVHTGRLREVTPLRSQASVRRRPSASGVRARQPRRAAAADGSRLERLISPSRPGPGVRPQAQRRRRGRPGSSRPPWRR